MDLERIARQLVQEIASTGEFMELKEAQSNIERYPHLQQEIKTFQRKQKDIMSRAASPQDAEQMLSQLNNKFQSLSQIPEVRSMIQAGERFNEMMFAIYKEINETLESYLKY
ncbi:YlbF family regulator [Anaerophilus nitritogenes]|uniref:YlbF family regulator n=1 Tax=Anaerophilus nitritogenes TaxID=2498136 RepID=UPI00101B6BBF|nr:YlbF family regulator [Anaerophilus nitritogenes]